MYGLQAEKLQHHEEQEERSGQNRDEEVLQILPQAHSTQGNEIMRGGALYV
jgi:hypothetical protein